jgi:hypothetical protein
MGQDSYKLLTASQLNAAKLSSAEKFTLPSVGEGNACQEIMRTFFKRLFKFQSARVPSVASFQIKLWDHGSN